MKILISGGGIAGITIALYLQNSGHEIKITDKASSFQNAGYGLSLKSFGIKITKELGLYQTLKDHAVSVHTFEMLNSNGKLLRRIPKNVIDEMTGESVLIGRRDLHSILFHALSETIKISYDTTMTSIAHAPEHVIVTFSNGVVENFDLVIIAEGLRSSTRKLLFGNGGWTPFDITYAATFIETEHHFDLGIAQSFKGKGKTIAFFPITKNQIAIQASFRNNSTAQYQLDNSKKLLTEVFKGFTYVVTNLLNNINNDTFIFYDTVAMIELPSYISDRTLLLGDAAYCPTFLSGMGASLGMLGAKVLSQSLSDFPDIKDALGHFDTVMHPFAKHFQNNAKSNMNRELPRSNVQTFINDLIVSKIPLGIMKKAIGKQLLAENELMKHI